MESYNQWIENPTKENMANIIKDLDYTITSEIQGYKGPKSLLKGRAKMLAASAVKTYDPASKAHLKSWIVTNLQPLRRYSNQLSPEYTPEVTGRDAAELNKRKLELEDDLGYEPSAQDLADHIGMNIKKVKRLQKATRVIMNNGQIPTDAETGSPTFTEPGINDNLGEAIEVVTSSLDPRDLKIYKYSQGSRNNPPMSGIEIAKRLGVSAAYISNRLKDIRQRIVQVESNVL